MSERTDEFYVGYLPVGARQRLLLRFVAPGLLWLLVAISALIAANQRDPGTGSWASEETALSGTVTIDPYPVLHMPGEGASIESVLLVEQGKITSDRAAQFDGQTVDARGLIIERRGLRMLELAPGAPGLAASATDRAPVLPAVESLGEAELIGEIVDSKCFLGVMKPGEGKTHRTCAVLCIRGGIPPALASRGPDGGLTFHLLIGTDGRALNAEVLDLVAEHVRVRGRQERRGELNYLRVDPSSITRL